jgi:hypothetical protein
VVVVGADYDLDDRQALALELSRAAQVAAPLRKAARRAALLLLAAAATARTNPSGQLTPAQQQQLRTALDTAIAALAIGVAGNVMRAVAAGAALALRQETAMLRQAGIDPATLDVRSRDPVLARAGDNAEASLARALDRLRRDVARGALATPTALEALAAQTVAPARAVETSVRWATNRDINDTTLQIARATATVAPPPVPDVPRAPIGLTQGPTFGEPPRSGNGRSPLAAPGLRVVWVAERGACLTCLALSGQVIDPNSGDGFNENASFSPHGAMAVWPPGMPLMSPPRHPNCRCRLRIITAANAMLPEALRREAQRSVARGWSDSASQCERLTAADRLIHHANRLPRTVNERARRDVASGSFSTRHRPRAPHLRADSPR